VGDSGRPDANLTIDELVAALETADSVEADALVQRVGWTGGWPTREGRRWLFVTRWDDALEPVSLVGDVVGWDGGTARATRTSSGSYFYALVDESSFRVPPAGAKYKWLDSTGTFRAPPEATAYGYDDFGEHGWVAPPMDAPYLERFPVFLSRFLEEPRAFRAYLPAGFEPRSSAAARARTLLLHDGQNLFDPEAAWGGWRVPAAMGAHPDVVVLAIDNAPDRMEAYTHVQDVVGGAMLGGRAGDYLRLVEEEALPFFRERYGVEARGRSLAVGGSSLGGLVSLYLPMVDSSLAGCVIAMSPTLGWGAYRAGAMEALVGRWTTRLPVSVYLDSGGEGTCSDGDGDGVFEDSDDSDNYCVTSQLRDRLSTLGYVHGVDLFHWWDPGAAHNEAAWASRLPRALASCTEGGWAAP
jgi:predicted alpha/beta superfamily hydrolase